jgi:hypothetical protein
MAMELHVFSNRRLASIAEWQRAIDIEHFPLRLPADVDFAGTRGLLPVWLDNKQSGFEIYHDDVTETIKLLGAANFTQAWEYALGLRWGGYFSELQAAWMAAAAYAAGTGGIVFDHEEGKSLSPREARDMVANIVRDIPRAEAFMAEIKKKFETKS